MDLFSIECFLAVFQSGSFTKAAKQVGRTQSAVTQQISNLEKSLGTELFNREKKTALLTRQGELFLSYALKIHALHKEALDKFREPELIGEVRFGVPEDFATLLLQDVLTEFKRTHPKVILNVDCDFTLNLYEKFKINKLDIVIVKMRSPEDFPLGLEIWNEPLVWVGHPTGFNSLLEISPLPVVLSPPPCVYRRAALDALEQIRLPAKTIFTSSSYTSIIAAVRANLGITALPSTMIPEGVQLLKSPLLPPLPEIHLSLLTKENPCSTVQSLKNHILSRLPNPSRIERPTYHKKEPFT